MEYLKLNTGYQMPMVGLGTLNSGKDVVGEAVKTAIDLGYRHIDCALLYDNEAEIGDAIASKIAEGTIRREDIFITGKLWNQFHRPGAVKEQMEKTLKDLKTSYVDLYLLHWPIATKESSETFFPVDDNGKHILADYDYLDTWKAIEDIQKEGLARTIGLSNFNSKQIKRILEYGTVKPAMLQIEIHPFFNNRKIVEFAQENGLCVTAYSPFASPDNHFIPGNPPRLFDNKTLAEIASGNGCTKAQASLKWLIQRKIAVVPKSVTPSRIKENLSVFDIFLSNDDMRKMYSIDNGYRACPADIWEHSPYFPFGEDL